MDRRKFIQTAVASTVVTAAAPLAIAKSEGKHPSIEAMTGNSIQPEFSINKLTGEIQKTKGQRLAFSRCYGCLNTCGQRVRVDEDTDQVLRVSGNPYHPANNMNPIAMDTPVKEAYAMLAGESGATHRATTCGRGSATANSANEERRVTAVLKRAGNRGEGKWITIPYEQALEEIVEGGDLFGEGSVEGLRSIRKLDELAAPGQPEFGNSANHLLMQFIPSAVPRSNLFARFAYDSWGTRNVGTKSAYCGAQSGQGRNMIIFPEKSNIGSMPDLMESEFSLHVAHAPGASGWGLNADGQILSEARVNGKLKYVVVDPILRNSVSSNTSGEWLPILPGTDTPFLYSIVRTLIEEKLYNEPFLTAPSMTAAQAIGELHSSDATHLVAQTGSSARQFIQAAALGLGGENEHLVVDVKTGELMSAEKSEKAELFVDRIITLTDGSEVHVKSSMQIVQEEAMRTSMADYAKATGIPEQKLKAIGVEFGSHGRKACARTRTGSNSADGFMSAWLFGLLNVLVGSVNAKGGSISISRKSYSGMGGERYDLVNFKGRLGKGKLGVSLAREGRYEDSTEYKTKVARGENPYPSEHPWMEKAQVNHMGEYLTSHTNQSPYAAKAFINWRANVVYAHAGLDQKVINNLKDPKTMPLSIAIDCMISETANLCDYIIPDLAAHEEYASGSAGAQYYHGGVCAVAPVVTPRTVKTAKGEHVSMEQFLIDVAVKMELPGFGKDAIAAKDGRKRDLFTLEDWVAPYFSNMAKQIGNLPKATVEDREWSGIDRALEPLKSRLSKEELDEIGYLFSRGGYFVPMGDFYSGEFQADIKGAQLHVYNEAFTRYIHSYSGENFPGIPIYKKNNFWNGDEWDQHWDQKEFPLLFSSYKPTYRSNFSVSFKPMQAISQSNFIYMHTDTAKEYGLKSGDAVEIASLSGVPQQGILHCDEGVVKGAVCIGVGAGHKEGMGGEDREIDGIKIPGLAYRSAGTSVNPMLPTDPTRNGVSLLLDYWTGCNARHGVRVKVTKVS